MICMQGKGFDYFFQTILDAQCSQNKQPPFRDCLNHRKKSLPALNESSLPLLLRQLVFKHIKKYWVFFTQMCMTQNYSAHVVNGVNISSSLLFSCTL